MNSKSEETEMMTQHLKWDDMVLLIWNIRTLYSKGVLISLETTDTYKANSIALQEIGNWVDRWKNSRKAHCFLYILGVISDNKYFGLILWLDNTTLVQVTEKCMDSNHKDNYEGCRYQSWMWNSVLHNCQV